jgi:hypothetical protein
MITISAFIGKAPYHDFVSVTFLPLLPILGLGLYWVNKVSIVPVHAFMLFISNPIKSDILIQRTRIGNDSFSC